MKSKINTDQQWIEDITDLYAEEYPLFFTFCIKLASGLRKEALIALTKFLETSKEWDDYTMLHFVNELFSRLDEYEKLEGILVHPLREELIRPALNKFIEREPENFIHYYWKGKYLRIHHDLKNAYKINPSYVPLQIALLKSLDYFLWTSTHHLPYGYGGSIPEDMEDINLAKEILSKIEQPDPGLMENFADYESELLEYVNRRTT